MRQIEDPVVAAAPAGVRIRTRIRPTTKEADALTAIGTVLGGLYRGELAERIPLGRMDHKTHAAWRAQRKHALTAASSSRWAGAITRTVEDQYQLGMRGLAALVADLRAAVEVLSSAARCARRTRTGQRRRVRSAHAITATPGLSQRGRTVRQDPAPGHAEHRLTIAVSALAAGRPSITAGGKRLWRNRSHLNAADMTEQQWRDRWEAARLFLTADGESGKSGGNETIRVDAAGQLRIKTPGALVDQFGSHLVIAEPIWFGHRGQEWADRVGARQAVRYDISYDPDRDRWYLDASWKTTPEPARDIDELRFGWVLGSTSTRVTWPPTCSTHQVTRSVNRSTSTCSPRICVRPGVMGGCVRRSRICSTTLSTTTAQRS